MRRMNARVSYAFQQHPECVWSNASAGCSAHRVRAHYNFAITRCCHPWRRLTAHCCCPSRVRKPPRGACAAWPYHGQGQLVVAGGHANRRLRTDAFVCTAAGLQRRRMRQEPVVVCAGIGSRRKVHYLPIRMAHCHQLWGRQCMVALRRQHCKSGFPKRFGEQVVEG